MEILGAKEFKSGIIAAYNNLEKNKELVNSLNVFPVPDGDTGTNMSLTMKSVFSKLQSVDENDMKGISKALGTGSLMGARGNSGVILSQLCRGVTLVLDNNETMGTKEIAQAFDKAKETAYKAVLKPTEGTILTVSRLMAEFALANYEDYDDTLRFLKDIIIEGNRALESTPDLLPVLKQAGVVDAGGKGLMLLVEGFYAYLSGEVVDMTAEVADRAQSNATDKVEDIHSHIEKPEDIKFGYCTEFFINHDGSQDYEEWREFISDYGDSIVVVGDESMIKTHIHTDHPGKVLEFALQRGYLTGLKIENMREQNKEVNAKKAAEKKAEELKENGFIAISTGEGFNDIFKDLGVNEIISGGQTMNPSTEDIVDAANAINAKNIYIFPNNKNIILAAKQAVQVVEDKNLIVIETRSIPEAFTALLHFDETASVEENTEVMSSAIDEVKTLELTYAVRDTKVGDLEISKDDIIGIDGKDIVIKGSDINQAMIDLVEHGIDDMSGLVTIYYGEDVSEEQSAQLNEELSEKLDHIDIEVVYGGQPLYYYIASIE